jgi:peptide/nickel transport system substrate-binding protein
MQTRSASTRPIGPAVRAAGAVLVFAAAAALAGCATAEDDAPIRVGWAAQLPDLDPVVGDRPVAFALLSQVHGSLLTIEDGQPVPDLAVSAEFTAPGEFTVDLRPGLAFANGHALTASDVVFSFERQQMLQVEGGPWPQLANLETVEAVDDTTVIFRLGSDQDAGFPFVLAGQAGLILDEETFFADQVTPDDVVIGEAAFGGPFAMSVEDGVTRLAPSDGYDGLRPAMSLLELRSGDSDELAAALQEGAIDVLIGPISASSIETLTADSALSTVRAASGRVRLLSFDLDHMPFGAATADADAAKALAVRTAVADVIDRDDLVASVGPNQIAPLFGYLPRGIVGAVDIFSDISGAGAGSPDIDKAAADLAAAGITTPIALTIHVDTAEIGLATAEVEALAEQLEASDLFTVSIVETDAEGLVTALQDGELSVAFRSFVSSTLDPQVYLERFHTGGPLAWGFGDTAVDDLLDAQRIELDPAARLALLDQLQAAIAGGLPAIPVSQGVRLVFATSSVLGIALDDTVPLDLSALSR